MVYVLLYMDSKASQRTGTFDWSKSGKGYLIFEFQVLLINGNRENKHVILFSYFLRVHVF